MQFLISKSPNDEITQALRCNRFHFRVPRRCLFYFSIPEPHFTLKLPSIRYTVCLAHPNYLKDILSKVHQLRGSDVSPQIQYGPKSALLNWQLSRTSIVEFSGTTSFGQQTPLHTWGLTWFFWTSKNQLYSWSHSLLLLMTTSQSGRRNRTRGLKTW